MKPRDVVSSSDELPSRSAAAGDKQLVTSLKDIYLELGAFKCNNCGLTTTDRSVLNFHSCFKRRNSNRAPLIDLKLPSSTSPVLPPVATVSQAPTKVSILKKHTAEAVTEGNLKSKVSSVVANCPDRETTATLSGGKEFASVANPRHQDDQQSEIAVENISTLSQGDDLEGLSGNIILSPTSCLPTTVSKSPVLSTDSPLDGSLIESVAKASSDSKSLDFPQAVAPTSSSSFISKPSSLKCSPPKKGSQSKTSFVTYDKEIIVCEFCNFKSKVNNLEYFWEHLMQHLVSKPYSCIHCSQTFASREQFITHCRTEHPDKISRCVLRNIGLAKRIVIGARKKGRQSFSMLNTKLKLGTTLSVKVSLQSNSNCNTSSSIVSSATTDSFQKEPLAVCPAAMNTTIAFTSVDPPESLSSPKVLPPTFLSSQSSALSDGCSRTLTESDREELDFSQNISSITSFPETSAAAVDPPSFSSDGQRNFVEIDASPLTTSNASNFCFNPAPVTVVSSLGLPILNTGGGFASTPLQHVSSISERCKSLAVLDTLQDSEVDEFVLPKIVSFEGNYLAHDSTADSSNETELCNTTKAVYKTSAHVGQLDTCIDTLPDCFDTGSSCDVSPLVSSQAIDCMNLTAQAKANNIPQNFQTTNTSLCVLPDDLNKRDRLPVFRFQNHQSQASISSSPMNHLGSWPVMTSQTRPPAQNVLQDMPQIPVGSQQHRSVENMVNSTNRIPASYGSYHSSYRCVPPATPTHSFYSTSANSNHSPISTNNNLTVSQQNSYIQNDHNSQDSVLFRHLLQRNECTTVASPVSTILPRMTQSSVNQGVESNNYVYICRPLQAMHHDLMTKTTGRFAVRPPQSFSYGQPSAAMQPQMSPVQQNNIPRFLVPQHQNPVSNTTDSYGIPVIPLSNYSSSPNFQALPRYDILSRDTIRIPVLPRLISSPAISSLAVNAHQTIRQNFRFPLYYPPNVTISATPAVYSVQNSSNAVSADHSQGTPVSLLDRYLASDLDRFSIDSNKQQRQPMPAVLEPAAAVSRANQTAFFSSAMNHMRTATAQESHSLPTNSSLVVRRQQTIGRDTLVRVDLLSVTPGRQQESVSVNAVSDGDLAVGETGNQTATTASAIATVTVSDSSISFGTQSYFIKKEKEDELINTPCRANSVTTTAQSTIPLSVPISSAIPEGGVAVSLPMGTSGPSPRSGSARILPTGIMWNGNYVCLPCRQLLKCKTDYYVHVWNHEHPDGQVCDRCSGEKSCTTTDSSVKDVENNGSRVPEGILNLMSEAVREKLLKKFQSTESDTVNRTNFSDGDIPTGFLDPSSISTNLTSEIESFGPEPSADVTDSSLVTSAKSVSHPVIADVDSGKSTSDKAESDGVAASVESSNATSNQGNSDVCSSTYNGPEDASALVTASCADGVSKSNPETFSSDSVLTLNSVNVISDRMLVLNPENVVSSDSVLKSNPENVSSESVLALSLENVSSDSMHESNPGNINPDNESVKDTRVTHTIDDNVVADCHIPFSCSKETSSFQGEECQSSDTADYTEEVNKLLDKSISAFSSDNTQIHSNNHVEEAQLVPELSSDFQRSSENDKRNVNAKEEEDRRDLGTQAVTEKEGDSRSSAGVEVLALISDLSRRDSDTLSSDSTAHETEDNSIQAATKETGSMFFVCPLCTFSCHLAVDFTMHLNSDHHDSAYFRCHLCNYKGFYTTDLTHHMTLHTTGPAETFTYHCPVQTDCHYSSSNINMFEEHLKTKHSQHQHFRCQDCLTDYSSCLELLEHIRINMVTLHSCSQCPARYLSRTQLKQHWRTEHKDVQAFRLRVLRMLLCKDRKQNGYWSSSANRSTVESVAYPPAVPEEITVCDTSQTSNLAKEVESGTQDEVSDTMLKHSSCTDEVHPVSSDLHDYLSTCSGRLLAEEISSKETTEESNSVSVQEDGLQNQVCDANPEKSHSNVFSSTEKSLISDNHEQLVEATSSNPLRINASATIKARILATKAKLLSGEAFASSESGASGVENNSKAGGVTVHVENHSVSAVTSNPIPFNIKIVSAMTESHGTSPETSAESLGCDISCKNNIRVDQEMDPNIVIEDRDVTRCATVSQPTKEECIQGCEKLSSQCGSIDIISVDTDSNKEQSDPISVIKNEEVTKSEDILCHFKHDPGHLQGDEIVIIKSDDSDKIDSFHHTTASDHFPPHPKAMETSKVVTSDYMELTKFCGNPQWSAALNGIMYRKEGFDLKCAVCDKLFQTAQYMHIHLFQHFSVPLFSCCYCPYRSASKIDVKLHQESMHSQNDCSDVLHLKANIKVLMNVIRSSSPVTMQSFATVCRGLGGYSDGILDHQGQGLVENCQNERTGGKEFADNEKSQDENDTVKETFVLGSVKVSAILSPLMSKSTSGYKCRICSVLFKSRFRIHEHIFEHLEVHTSACTYCSKTAVTSQSILRHIDKDHPGRAKNLIQVKFDLDKCVSKYLTKGQEDTLSPSADPSTSSLLPKSDTVSKMKTKMHLCRTIKIGGVSKFQCKACHTMTLTYKTMENHIKVCPRMLASQDRSVDTLKAKQIVLNRSVGQATRNSLHFNCQKDDEGAEKLEGNSIQKDHMEKEHNGAVTNNDSQENYVLEKRRSKNKKDRLRRNLTQKNHIDRKHCADAGPQASYILAKHKQASTKNKKDRSRRNLTQKSLIDRKHCADTGPQGNYILEKHKQASTKHDHILIETARKRKHSPSSAENSSDNSRDKNNESITILPTSKDERRTSQLKNSRQDHEKSSVVWLVCKRCSSKFHKTDQGDLLQNHVIETHDDFYQQYVQNIVCCAYCDLLFCRPFLQNHFKFNHRDLPVKTKSIPITAFYREEICTDSQAELSLSSSDSESSNKSGVQQKRRKFSSNVAHEWKAEMDGGESRRVVSLAERKMASEGENLTFRVEHDEVILTDGSSHKVAEVKLASTKVYNDDSSRGKCDQADENLQKTDAYQDRFQLSADHSEHVRNLHDADKSIDQLVSSVLNKSVAKPFWKENFVRNQESSQASSCLQKHLGESDKRIDTPVIGAYIHQQELLVEMPANSNLSCKQQEEQLAGLDQISEQIDQDEQKTKSDTVDTNIPYKYVCIRCNDGLNDRQKMVRHIRQHLDYKVFCCACCSDKFLFIRQLEQHCREKHSTVKLQIEIKHTPKIELKVMKILKQSAIKAEQLRGLSKSPHPINDRGMVSQSPDSRNENLLSSARKSEQVCYSPSSLSSSDESDSESLTFESKFGQACLRVDDVFCHPSKLRKILLKNKVKKVNIQDIFENKFAEISS